MTPVTRRVLHLLSPGGPRARLMIFPYHRVLAQEDPLLPGSPSAERFERHLQRIRKYCNPISLQEGVERLHSGSLPARAVAVTFDDGYANNLEIAAPLLKKYRVPATVFVAVDALVRGIMWNDLIIDAVRYADARIDAGILGLGTIELSPANRLSVIKQLVGKAQYLPTRNAPGDIARAPQKRYTPTS